MQSDATFNVDPDQVVACVSWRSPDNARLLQFASRLASRLNGNWYVLYVQTPSEEPAVIDARAQRRLGDTLKLANQLGAKVFAFKSQEVAKTILQFAREYRVGQVLIGGPRPMPWWRRVLRKKNIAEDLTRCARGITVTVIDAEYEKRSAQE